MPADALLSVRVAKDVQEAYSLVRDHYGINQSELVRMAPLLLVLLAERKFTERRREFNRAKESLRGNPSAPEILKIFQENYLEPRGPHFVEHLRDLAEDLDDIGKDAVRVEDIDLERDGFPRYRLFHSIQEQQNEITDQAALKRAAADTARKFVKDASAVPQNDSSPIPAAYDGPLLAIAREQLGKFLTEEQKTKLRQLFKDVVHGKTSNDEPPSDHECLEQAALEVARMIPSDLYLDEGYIPPQFDGRLLAIARAQLGKHLTLEQKVEARRLLRERIALEEGNR